MSLTSHVPYAQLSKAVAARPGVHPMVARLDHLCGGPAPAPKSAAELRARMAEDLRHAEGCRAMEQVAIAKWSDRIASAERREAGEAAAQTKAAA